MVIIWVVKIFFVQFFCVFFYILVYCVYTCIFLYAEYIMRNAGLEEAQAGIKIARRTVNNLRYVDNNTLMAESKEELKSLLMKVKDESEKADFKLNSRG